MNCTKLAEVSISEKSKLTSIGNSAFLNTALTQIYVPQNVTSIGTSAFNRTPITVFDMSDVLADSMTVGDYAINNWYDSSKPEEYPEWKDNFKCIYVSNSGAAASVKEKTSNCKYAFFVTNGGSVDATKTGFAAVYRTGYTAAWYENNEFSGTAFTGEPANAKVYYAKWTKSDSVALTSTPVADENGGVSATYDPDGAVTLSVQNPGAGWLYTWMKNGEQISAAGNSLTLYRPSDSGNYSVKVVAGGSGTEVWTSNTINVTITKAAGTASVSMEGWTYGETAKTPVPTSETNGTENVTYQYKVKDADDSTYSAEVPTAAGSYTVKATFPATENYEETAATTDFTIAQATHHSSSSSSSNPTYSVTTPSKSENGGVAVSSKNARKGDTVTVTVTPDAGYQLDKLTVTDKNGNVLKLTDKGDGKYSFTMPDGKVEIKAVFAKKVETSPFGDVSTDAYYYKAVQWAQEKGITDGISSDLFGPKQPCTRSQIVTFLWRAAGSPEPKGTAAGMTDVVPGSYYAKAVAWAVENGITTGTAEGTFSPDATCTRAQAVTFLARAQNATATGKTAFSDVPADSYFADAVAWAQANGVTTGTSETTFSPDNDCTRAQIVTFLYRANQGT